MSGGNSGASAIAALALAVHRAPARHPELLRGDAPLPPRVSILLRLAGGTLLQELDPALASLAPEHELRKAALFFTEHVLFQRDATHYRVLGLNPGTTLEQIKEHHRLLMRLFHPDRESQLGGHREHYATRANLAYNTLRDAGLRADYDATLKSQDAHSMQTPAKPARSAPVRAWRRRPEPESFWTVRAYPLLMRYLPQWVLAGTALVSVTLVGAVYLFNPPVQVSEPVSYPDVAAELEKPAAASKAPETTVQIVAVDPSGLDAVVEQFEQRIAAAGEVLAAPDPVTPESVKPPPVPAPENPAGAIAPGLAPSPAMNRMPALAASAKPAAADLATVAQPVAQKLPRPTVSAVAAAEPVRPALAASLLVLAPADEVPPPLPLPDPNTLLSRFLEAYERGDVQACMALLDDGLRTNVGGKHELHREYDALFRGTELRHVKILNMSWTRDGEFIRGVGRYRATLMRKGETLLRTQDGRVQVEMMLRGNSTVINELYYLASGRS
jgi:hypothetical protein